MRQGCQREISDTGQHCSGETEKEDTHQKGWMEGTQTYMDMINPNPLGSYFPDEEGDKVSKTSEN